MVFYRRFNHRTPGARRPVALKPESVHILVGTNDIAGNTGPNSADQYKHNIKAMVTLAKANGIKPILGSIPPAGQFAWRPGLKPAAQIIALNRWLKLCAEAEGLEFIDYHTLLASRDGAINQDLSFDGVPPIGQGHRFMTRMVR